MRFSGRISARQFGDPSLAATIERALDLSGLDPRRLEIEITEGTLMQNPEEADKLLERLRGMGVRISVDDFGTGYSSMNYLNRFPIDALKIDRSFVLNIPGKEAAAIIDLILTLARTLNLDVVAEGVETQEQAEFLNGRGCR